MTRWMKLISAALLVVLSITTLGSISVANAQGDSQDAGRADRLLMIPLLRETSKALNLKQVDILKELGSGKTLAEVIKGHNGDAAAIQAAVKGNVTDRVKQAVTNKRLTQEQADKLLADLDATLTRLLNTKWPGPTSPAERRMQAASLASLVRETAKQSNITQRELLKELREGKTLAQIAQARKADPAKIIDAAAATLTTQINKLVTDNKLTKEAADKLTAGLKDTLTTLMNTTNPLRPARRGINRLDAAA